MRKGSARLRGEAPAEHRVTVQLEDGGRVLQFGISAVGDNRYDPTWGMRDDVAARAGVTPKMVGAVVERALEEGWKPSEPGAPYEFTGDVDLGPWWEVSR